MMIHLIHSMTIRTITGCVIALLIVGCSSPVSEEPDDAGEHIRVMTFNIRWASPNDGANSWERRSDWVAALIDTSEAEIVGLQEVVYRQLVDIMAVQTRFDWIGVGRDDGLRGGEFSPILFDSTRFALISWDTQWLSATPDEVGSVGWDAALPRVATRATFRDKTTGREVRVINTHFDHRGVQARLESARLIRDWSSSFDIALGDFNVEPESAPYKAIVQGDWQDAGLSPPTMPDESGTFRTFDPASETSVRIDFIFHQPNWQVLTYDVLDPIVNGAYPSDHLPVVADLKNSAHMVE